MENVQNLTVCALGERLAARTEVKLVLVVQIIFCLLSLISTSVCMKRNMGGILHPNYTILLQLYLLTFIIHSLFHGAAQSYQLFLYVFKSGCGVTMPGAYCFALRHPTHSLIAIMTLLEFSITIERIVALVYRQRYNEFSMKLGIILGLLSYILGESFNMYLMHFSFPLRGYYIYCSSVNFLERFAGIDAYKLFGLTTIGMELFTVCVLFILVFIGRKIRKKNSYDLATRFEDKQNKDVLRGVLPTMLFHSLYTIGSTVLYYSVLNYVINEKGTAQYLFLGIASYTVPTYTFFAPLLLIYIQNKTKAKKIYINEASADQYFDTYKKMW